MGQRHVSVEQQSKHLLRHGACSQDPARGLLQLVLALIHLSEDKTLEEGKRAHWGGRALLVRYLGEQGTASGVVAVGEGRMGALGERE